MKNPKAFLLFCLSSICLIYSGYSRNPLLTTSVHPARKINSHNYSGSNSPLGLEQLRTDLYAVNSDGSVSLEDGTLILYNNTYSDSVSWLEDAKKLTNFAENLAMKRQGQLLAIEKRQIIGSSDSVFFNMTQMRQKAYELLITTTNLNHPNLLGFLQDSYTGASTPVNLNGTTPVTFSITSDPASASPNRFRLVYTSASLLSGIVPVTYSSVKAWEQSKTVNVEWKMENEISVARYEVEKSINGTEFTQVGSVAYSGKSSSTYDWVDLSPSTGNNFYRVKGISSNGEIQYSKILKISIGKTGNAISVYPNPVVSGVLGLQMNNMANGNYKVRLLNNFGQVLFSRGISHKEGSATETINVGQGIDKGIYRLEVINPDNSISNVNVAF